MKGITMNNKRGLIITTIIAVFLILISISSYNGLIFAEQTVQEKQSAVEVAMQRRVDLIPNLVATVKSSANHEEKVFTNLANARKDYNSANSLPDKAKANEEVSKSLDQLNVFVEAYPTLRSSEQYTTLMDQLEGSENRISVARDNYNSSVRSYNTKIKKFPGNLYARFFRFDKAPYFEATEGADKTPDVSTMLGD
jgi:LemA protein